MDAVHLVRFPGSTLALSASEILGDGAYGREHFRQVAQFDVRSRTARELRFRLFSDVSGCVLPEATYRVIADSVVATVERVDPLLVPYGTIKLYLIRRGTYFSKTTASFNWGRRIVLAFYHTCTEASAVADTLEVVATSLHESTHVIDEQHRSRSRLPSDALTERLADSVVGCLYEALERTPAGQAVADSYPLASYFGEGSMETGILPSERADESCSQWLAWVTRRSR